MDAPADASIKLSPDIKPSNMLSVVSLEVIDDFRNAKAENPLPPAPKVYDSLGDVKVDDDAPPPIPLVVCIDHGEHFTTKQKFATRNDLLEWVREKAMKLGFTTVIGKSDKGGNERSAFVTVICERGGSYKEYKRKTQCKITGSVKYECRFQLRGYLLIASDWNLKVGDGKLGMSMGTHEYG